MQFLANKKIILAVIGILIIGAIALIALNFLHSDPQITVGQKLIVTVTADLVEDMYGYQFKMNYDKDELGYSGEQTSEISEIQTIFYKLFEGYVLIGATMIGDKSGVSGKNIPVCQIIFTANMDGKLSDFSLTMEGINVVKSDLAYEENLSEWSFSVSTEK